MPTVNAANTSENPPEQRVEYESAVQLRDDPEAAAQEAFEEASSKPVTPQAVGRSTPERWVSGAEAAPGS